MLRDAALALAVALALALMCALQMPAAGRRISTFAGPFELLLRSIEPCPPELAGKGLANFTSLLTRDRRNPSFFLYNGVVNIFFNFTRDIGVRISISSWSSAGGWKEKAYEHYFPSVCDVSSLYVGKAYYNFAMAAFGEVRNCPFPAAEITFKNFPVDMRVDAIKEFVYGKWRVDLQLLRKNKVLSCERVFTDTVPRLNANPTYPASMNLNGTITYRLLEAQPI